MRHYLLLTEKDKDDVVPDGILQDEREVPAYSDEAMIFFAAHKGASMNPTLSEEDILEIRPYGESRVNEGDVIYFTAPGDASLVVHRVIGASGDCISTKGDNCRYKDPWLVSEKDIKGRVTAARRGRRRRKIEGGLPGLIIAHILPLRRSAGKWFSIPLRPLYRLVVRSGLLHKLVPGKLRPRAFAFECNGRRYIKLIAGGHVIGWHNDAAQNWKISPFFRPFICEEDLDRVIKGEIPWIRKT